MNKLHLSNEHCISVTMLQQKKQQQKSPNWKIRKNPYPLVYFKVAALRSIAQGKQASNC